MRPVLMLQGAALLAALGLVIWAGRKGSALAGQAWSAAGDAAYSINPLNNNNVIYQTANTATGAVLGGDETIGARIYNFFHPQQNDHNSPYYTGPGAIYGPFDPGSGGNEW